MLSHSLCCGRTRETGGQGHPGQGRYHSQSPNATGDLQGSDCPGGVAVRDLLLGTLTVRSLPGSRPSPPLESPQPTFSIAEPAAYSHVVRVPTVIAPEAAETGRHQPWVASSSTSPPFPSAAVTYPRSPSSVLWISFRTPAGWEKPSEAFGGEADTFSFTSGVPGPQKTFQLPLAFQALLCTPRCSPPSCEP